MAKTYTTTQAFAEMINLWGIHKEMELSSATTRGLRKRVNDHPNDPTKWKISIDKMEEMLTKFGFEVVQEKLWKK